MLNVLENQRVLQVVLEEYENHKLPRLIMIKEHVDEGERLYDEELTFLQGLYQEVNRYGFSNNVNQEFMRLYIEFAYLYRCIMDAALENERQ